MRTITENENPVSLLNESQTAQFLGLTIRCLQNWRSRGGGPPYIQISRRAIRYRRADLEAWIDARIVANTTDARRVTP